MTSAGSQIGPYEIVSSIGKGGMGEVWKARDPRLSRDVAIKISAQQFTDRFEREARAIAALNHSNICTLYDIGPNYLVMELVEGPTLAARIARGPIPIEESVNIAKQIANALEAAHEKGIIHRDLKPANIKIRPDGSVKVLDFGLATASAADEVNADTPTLTMTAPGMIMGTPGYMPPEQVRGQKADKRADIWAFGVVLFEMVTGQRPFEGETYSDMMASVIKEDPDWTRAPSRLHPLLRWCLEKDPRLRLRDIGDARRLLDENAPAVAVTSRSRVGRAGWAAATILALVAGALAFVHFSEKPAETPLTRLNMIPPEGTSFPIRSWTPPAVSPDGREVVFQALSTDGKSRLWLRPLDSLTARPLAGTDDGIYPFWSPDGKSLGFFAGSKLKKLDISGGPPTTLADAANPRGGTWSPSGAIVFAPTPYGLKQVSASGGAIHDAIPANPKTATRFPWFLPDGRHFMYLSGIAGVDYITHIATLNSPAEDRALPGTMESQAVYSEGHLLFLRVNTLMSRPFDTGSLSYTGDAVPVAEQIQVGYSVTTLASFGVSTNGVLVYQSGVNNVLLTWLDRTGKRLGTVGEPALMPAVSLSADNKMAAVGILDSSDAKLDIWLYDLLRGLKTRLTTSQGAGGVWSPDERTIFFQSNRLGRINLYRKPADGSHEEELLYADNLQKAMGSLSADGKYLAYPALDPKTGYGIWILPDPLGPIGAAKPYSFLQTGFDEQNPRFSPDGHWMAYVSNESGRNQVYVASFPGPGGKVQVSTAGGTQPRWRADGNELFYIAPGGSMMAAGADAKGGAFVLKKVETLFGPLAGLANYDASADGQRFLALLPPEGETGGPMTVVLNWTAGLKK
jgi:serine/threonine protein kinase